MCLCYIGSQKQFPSGRTEVSGQGEIINTEEYNCDTKQMDGEVGKGSTQRQRDTQE